MAKETETKKIVNWVKRNPWQRFVLSLLGIGILVGKWQWSVWHLYSLPEHSITAFTSITTNNDYVIGALVIFFVTGKLVYDWKNNTTSNIIEQANHISENIKEKREEVIKHYDLPPEEELGERYGDR